MPIKKNNFRSGTRKFVQNVGKVTKKTLNEIIITGAAYSNAITPRDTSDLVNSQYREVMQKTNGQYRAVVGYGARYSVWVHNSPGTLAGQPRTRKGSNGNYWDPDAEPQFLKKGFERDGAVEIKQLIIDSYKVKNIK